MTSLSTCSTQLELIVTELKTAAVAQAAATRAAVAGAEERLATCLPAIEETVQTASVLNSQLEQAEHLMMIMLKAEPPVVAAADDSDSSEGPHHGLSALTADIQSDIQSLKTQVSNMIQRDLLKV